MVPILLAILAQAPPPQAKPVDLPVSLERIREGLAKPDRFREPAPRPWRRPLFRVAIEEDMILIGDPWIDTSITPPWVRPTKPPVHFEFLEFVTPEEVRSSILYPCCDVVPVIQAVGSLVTQGIRGVKERRARREVERVMPEAGIKR